MIYSISVSIDSINPIRIFQKIFSFQRRSQEEFPETKPEDPKVHHCYGEESSTPLTMISPHIQIEEEKEEDVYPLCLPHDEPRQESESSLPTVVSQDQEVMTEDKALIDQEIQTDTTNQDFLKTQRLLDSLKDLIVDERLENVRLR